MSAFVLEFTTNIHETKLVNAQSYEHVKLLYAILVIIHIQHLVVYGCNITRRKFFWETLVSETCCQVI